MQSCRTGLQPCKSSKPEGLPCKYRKKDVKYYMAKTINQKGVSLIAAIFIIVILGFMGVMFVSLIGTSTLTSVNDMQSMQALYVAEGGLERAVRFLDSPILDPTSTNLDRRGACASVTGDVALTNVAHGPGQFTVTTEAGSPFYPAVATTLSAGITPLTTTINVNATAGYAPFGRIMIDRELIDYYGIIGNSFTGAVRGRDGSQATVHANGTPVGQYQCTATSTGGIPTLAAPAAQRAVREGIQLQEGWAVGGGGLPTDNLNSVHCTDANNCWAVGDAGTILRWNGVGWSQLVSPTVENLNEVHCANANNCWAVGDAGGVAAERPLFIQWNGATWSQFDSTLININENLNSVYCVNNNYCWGVGTPGGTNPRQPFLINWNGAVWAPYDSSLINLAEVMNSVSMVSNIYGWAVGTPGGTNPRQPFLINWSGAAWTPYDSSAINLALDLNSVSMASAVYGWTVGNPGGAANRRPFLMSWDGAAWTPYDSSAINLALDLNSVSMVSAVYGWTVGNPGGAANRRPFLMSWNGAAWAPYDSTALNLNFTLNSVTCTAANDCWAVGDAGTILRWNGAAWSQWQQANATLLRWRDVAWNDVSATLSLATNRLRAISMLSYADGWAVGSRTGATTNGWMFRRWNNPSADVWNDFGVDTAPTVARNLNAVYMISSNDGWAAGNRTGATTNGWILLRWNGAGWSRFAVDTAPAIAQNLNAIFMIPGGTEGWAVGNRTGAATNGWTFFRWNGAAWNRVVVDTAPATARNLNSIFMFDTDNNGIADDGWAVGDSNGARPVVLRWDIPCGGGAGTGTWNDCTNGIPAVNLNLNWVFMVGTDDGWAAGDGGLLLHWDGAAWAQVAVPTVQNLDSMYLIGPRRRPQAAWQEVIQ